MDDAAKQLVLGLVFFACPAQDISQQATSRPPSEVFFVPKGGCTKAAVKELNPANESRSPHQENHRGKTRHIGRRVTVSTKPVKLYKGEGHEETES